MGLLAEGRKKARYSTDPRGNQWAQDKNKAGSLESVYEKISGFCPIYNNKWLLSCTTRPRASLK